MNLLESSDKPDVPAWPRKLNVRFVPSAPVDIAVRPMAQKQPSAEASISEFPDGPPLDNHRHGFPKMRMTARGD